MIACGFDVHRAQITFDLLDQETGEAAARADRAGDARSSCGYGWRGWRRRGWWSPWRARPVGGSWPRSWRRRGRRRCWRSQARRAPCAARSGERRPIAPTRAGCVSRLERGELPRSPGSAGAPARAALPRRTAPDAGRRAGAPGCSACTRSSSTTHPVVRRAREPRRPWAGCARPSSRRPGRELVDTALATVDFLDTQLAALDSELRRFSRAHPATQRVGSPLRGR